MIDFQFKSDVEFGGKPYPSGVFTGYGTVFNNLDRGGYDDNDKPYADIILNSAYTPKALQDFVNEGRCFDGHQHLKGADPSKAVGYALDARKDEYGVKVTMAFFSDANSQDLRSKSQELQKAGRIVPLSQVVRPGKGGTRIFMGKDNIVKAINQYVKPEWREDALSRANDLVYVRVLEKGATLAFVDLVSRAAEPHAMVELVKDNEVTEPSTITPVKELAKSTYWSRRVEKEIGKGAFEEEIIEHESSVYFLWNMFMNCYYDVQCMEEAAEGLGIAFDANAAYIEIVNEFSSRLLASILEEEAKENELSKSDAGNIGTNEKVHPLSLRGQAEGLGLLAKGLISRISKSIEPLEVGKESRVLSDASLTNIEDAAQAIKDLADSHGGKLMDMAKAERTRRNAKKKTKETGKEETILETPAPIVVPTIKKLSAHDLKKMGYTIPTQSVQ